MSTSNASRAAAAVVAALLLGGAPGLAAALPALEQARDSLALVAAAAPARARETATTTTAPPRASAVEGGSDVGSLRIGATAGLDLADGFTGVAIRPQVAYALATLGPGLHLDVAGDIGVALGGATGYSARYVAIVPAARLRYDLTARLAIYGDIGLGLFVLRTSLDNNLGSDTQVGAVLRIPIGLRYALTPALDLVFEPAGVSMYFNTAGNKFHYSLLAGLLVKI